MILSDIFFLLNKNAKCDACTWKYQKNGLFVLFSCYFGYNILPIYNKIHIFAPNFSTNLFLRNFL